MFEKIAFRLPKKKKKIAFHIENSPSQLDKSEPLILTTILRLRKKKIKIFVITVYMGDCEE